jgi:hypothetical protein
VAQRPAGAERRRLGRVDHAEPEFPLVAELALELGGAVAHAQHRFAHAISRQPFEQAREHRAAPERRETLRPVTEARAQTRAEPAGEHERLHGASLPRL